MCYLVALAIVRFEITHNKKLKLRSYLKITIVKNKFKFK